MGRHRLARDMALDVPWRTARTVILAYRISRGRLSPLGGPIQRRSDLDGCCAVVVSGPAIQAVREPRSGRSQ
jgi:hypothetical protein